MRRAGLKRELAPGTRRIDISVPKYYLTTFESGINRSQKGSRLPSGLAGGDGKINGEMLDTGLAGTQTNWRDGRGGGRRHHMCLCLSRCCRRMRKQPLCVPLALGLSWLTSAELPPLHSPHRTINHNERALRFQLPRNSNSI